MGIISKKARSEIFKLIEEIVSKYLKRALDKPKANSGNPFSMALLKDFEPLIHRIHGLKGSMGSQMEKIAEIIAIESWGKDNVKRKINIDVQLPKNVFQAIDSIINNLSNASKLPNYRNEKQQIIEACQNTSHDFESYTYEFDLELYDQEAKRLYYLEMKGPDPNTTEIPGAKKRLLAEMAWGFLNKECEDVDAILALYYNNKFPKPYKNPKVLYYFDPDGGLIIHDNFWNFLGRGESTYQELLTVFSDYSKQNKKRIWDGFSKLIDIDPNRS